MLYLKPVLFSDNAFASVSSFIKHLLGLELGIVEIEQCIFAPFIVYDLMWGHTYMYRYAQGDRRAIKPHHRAAV